MSETESGAGFVGADGEGSPEASGVLESPREDEATLAGDVDVFEEETAPFAPQARDLVAAWMVRAILLLLAVALAGTASLVFYLLSMRGAPRTQNERNIATYEAAVKEQPKEVENWGRLAYSYAGAQRYREALATVDKARQSFKGNPLLDIAHADILRMSGRTEEALKVYEAAEKTSVSFWNKRIQEEKKRQIDFQRSNPFLIEVYIGRGLSLSDLGRPSEALQAFDTASRLDPQNAFVLAYKGDMLLELGKTDEAEASYMEALNYVPDYLPALRGIQRLRGGS